MKQLAPWRARMSAMELVLVAALVIRWRNAGASHKRTRRMRDATKYRHRDCCIGQRRRRSCSILHLRHTRIDRQRRFRRPLASPSSMRSENQKMLGAVEQRAKRAMAVTVPGARTSGPLTHAPTPMSRLCLRVSSVHARNLCRRDAFERESVRQAFLKSAAETSRQRHSRVSQRQRVLLFHMPRQLPGSW